MSNLTQVERKLLRRIIDNPQVALAKVHTWFDLEKRGYVRISEAYNMFGSSTGLSMCRVTEAGKIVLEMEENAVHS